MVLFADFSDKVVDLLTNPVLIGLAAYWLDSLRRDRKKKDEDAAAAKVLADQLATNDAEQVKRDAQRAIQMEQARVAAVNAAKEVREVKTTVAETSKAAATKADGVAEQLIKTTAATDATLANLTDTNAKIHTLVNSNMATQLKIAALALRRVADMTRHPDDVAAAVTAERAYADHQSKQQVVDSVNDPAPPGTH